MSIRCVVLDFDGTFTDVEVEGAPFVEKFRGALADLLGRSVDAEWDAAMAEIRTHPAKYGWPYEGRIVAPAADPYVRSTAAAHLVLDGAGVLADRDRRHAILQVFYHQSYRHTVTAFRPDARAVLEKILSSGLAAYVVTNATPDVVARKLRELAPAGLERLHVAGDAQKFVVCEATTPDPRFDAIPAELRLDGLERPLHPRRGNYFDALVKIWRETGAGPAETLVVGDIFELDLLLPSQLGCHVQLVDSPGTPPHERAQIAALGPRGAHSPQLSACLSRLP